ncbi:MAG: hypothetical protein JXQ75_09175 [Phycisphaerae bacterium]|nr:hypothetical protein [Phycisphaerae bacterium]
MKQKVMLLRLLGVAARRVGRLPVWQAGLARGRPVSLRGRVMVENRGTPDDMAGGHRLESSRIGRQAVSRHVDDLRAALSLVVIMTSNNDSRYGPVHVQPDRVEADLGKAVEWSPVRALVGAAVWGLVLAVVFVGLTGPLAYYFPRVVLHMLLRTFLAFVVAWIMFATVQGAAGMVGTVCTTMALGLTALVLLSHHVVFAVHGVLGSAGQVVAGWVWLHPVNLAIISGLPLLIGGGLCAAYCHRNGAHFSVIPEVLARRFGQGSPLD